jgi:nucleoside-diphosphate-sugar epimerase
VTRLLVTGVTGFIGTHCLREVLAGGYGEIHAVSRSGEGPAYPNLIWHAADLRIPREAAELIEHVRPTHLLHAAWIATPGRYLDSPENDAWRQVTIAMARAFAEQAGRRFVGIGSSAEYAETDVPCREDETPLAPVSAYGRAKAETWEEVAAIAGARGTDAAWGRLFPPYGPGDRPQRLIPATLAKLRARETMLLSSGMQQRDFVYAPDAAKMLAGLLASRATGAFNIGSGEARTVRSVVEALADRLGARDLLQFDAVPPRAWEPAVLVADMRKLDGLGLVVRTPMVKALDDLIAAQAG